DENAQLELSGAMLSDLPAAEIEGTPSGGVRLVAFEPGAYQFINASGRMDFRNVLVPPRHLQFSNPCRIDFPRQQIVLGKLISWTDYKDDYVKYFSGTATYSNNFDVPDVLFTSDHRFYLDLGNVKNLARVRLNGADLGVLWKAP